MGAPDKIEFLQALQRLRSMVYSSRMPRTNRLLPIVLVAAFAWPLADADGAGRSRKAKGGKKGQAARMVKVAAGTYAVSTPDSDSGETRRVALKAFRIDRHEVTVASYRRCVLTAKCSEPQTSAYFSLAQRRIDFEAFCNWNQAGREDHPINCLTRGQAAEYCASVGKRLPTSDQWEAANYGEPTPKRRTRYVFGDTIPKDAALCWNRKEHREGTCPTTSTNDDTSWRGVKGLAGNVSEWTRTDACPGGGAECRNKLAVIRGGNWYNAYAVKAGVRRARLVQAASFDHLLGFRCISK